MIAANSPLKYASPGPTLHPNPAGIRSRFPCFGLGSRSSELSKPWVGRSRTKMEFLQRVTGGWSRILGIDYPAFVNGAVGEEDNDATAVPEHLVIMVNGINGRILGIDYPAFVNGAAGEEDNDATAVPEHLVIMVNGINGSAADWRYGAEQFVRRLPDKVLVHCSESNHSKLTFDGVDTMGERLADEVWSIVRNNSKVKKISIVAHSLGGLIARFAIGKLYASVPKSDHPTGGCLDKDNTNNFILEQPCLGTIAGLEPMNFITVATPHLGSKGNKQLPFLCGLPFLERRARQTAHLIVGRSGKHLFLTDKDKDKPLLLRMVNDTDDLKFISALRAFKRRVAYANANYDHMVGWRTSSIRRQSELPKSNRLVPHGKYQHIVVERESFDNAQYKVLSLVGDQQDELEEEMIRGLTQVPWERVDVSFSKSRQRFIAHNTIQVKRYWLNSDGADVVFHIIDNFLL